MKKYYVEIPVTMKLMVSVEAETKEEAVEKIFEGDISLETSYDGNKFGFVDIEWEIHEKVVEGNVYHGVINEIYVQEDHD